MPATAGPSQPLKPTHMSCPHFTAEWADHMTNRKPAFRSKPAATWRREILSVYRSFRILTKITHQRLNLWWENYLFGKTNLDLTLIHITSKCCEKTIHSFLGSYLRTHLNTYDVESVYKVTRQWINRHDCVLFTLYFPWRFRSGAKWEARVM